MNYQITFTQKNISIFGNQLKGNGIQIDLSDASDIHKKVDMKNQDSLQKYAENLMKENNTNWAISGFGEYREIMFRDLDAKQMVDERRFYHLGMDIWNQVGSSIYSPLDGEIIESGYEEGYGNYGGYIVIKYNSGKEKFYAVFGHLNPETLVATGTKIQKGEELAKLGNMNQNGGYFFHTHIQILTELGYKSGFVSKGYANEETFHEIRKYVLDPAFFVFGS